MTRLTPILIFSILLLSGCKSGGLVKWSTRTPQNYVPEVPGTSVAPEGSNLTQRPEGLKSKPSHPDSPVIRQVSLEESVSDLPQTPADSVKNWTMSLTQSISTALERNPDLITLRQSEGVSRATLGVAQTYPFNPFVQVQVTPWQDQRNGGSGATYHYVLLMQTIQLAHQQQYREQGAAFSLNSVRWNIHQAELQTLVQTERLYFNALYLRGLMELAEQNDSNNHQLLRILERQLDAGQATAADVAIVQIDAASTRQQRQLASANYRTALRDLARQAGVSPEQIQNVEGDLRTIKWRLPGSTVADFVTAGDGEFQKAALEARSAMLSWASSRPDVMAARSDIDVARASLNLASASKTPDLQIGPYYQATIDSSAYVGFRGQLDLPVINTGEPLERQRTAEYHQRLTAWQQVQRRAALEAEAAFDRYETALMAVTSASESETPDLPAELKGLENQFLAGEIDVVRVVQARSSLIQNQRARLDLVNEVAQSAAALTGATGIAVEEVFRFL